MNNKGKTWVTLPNEERPIPLGKEGIAAVEPITVPKWFQQQVDKHQHEVNNFLPLQLVNPICTLSVIFMFILHRTYYKIILVALYCLV